MSDPNRERWEREAEELSRTDRSGMRPYEAKRSMSETASYVSGYLAAASKYALDAAEVDDWRESARKAAEEPCGDERHCACVGLLREELKLAHEAAELHIGIGARAIRARAEAEEQRDHD